VRRKCGGQIIQSLSPGMVCIPAGWTCFSSCNFFIILGGDLPLSDRGGILRSPIPARCHPIGLAR
jgi:hypothetical protein